MKLTRALSAVRIKNDGTAIFFEFSFFSSYYSFMYDMPVVFLRCVCNSSDISTENFEKKFLKEPRNSRLVGHIEKNPPDCGMWLRRFFGRQLWLFSLSGRQPFRLSACLNFTHFCCPPLWPSACLAVSLSSRQPVCPSAFLTVSLSDPWTEFGTNGTDLGQVYRRFVFQGCKTYDC